MGCIFCLSFTYLKQCYCTLWYHKYWIFYNSFVWGTLVNNDNILCIFFYVPLETGFISTGLEEHEGKKITEFTFLEEQSLYYFMKSNKPTVNCYTKYNVMAFQYEWIQYELLILIKHHRWSTSVTVCGLMQCEGVKIHLSSWVINILTHIHSSFWLTCKSV